MTKLSSWALEQRRSIAVGEFKRVLAPGQVFVGSFKLSKPYQPAKKTRNPADSFQTVDFRDKDNILYASYRSVRYLLPVEALAQEFRVGKKKPKIKPTPSMMLRVFKLLGDRGRLPAAEIKVTK